MKKAVAILLLMMIIGCASSQKPVSDFAVTAKPGAAKESVRIANDSLEYEIIITDPGFNTFLTTARPRSYYGQSYLENRNLFYVAEYNRRVLDPLSYNPNLYEMRIDYDSKTNYGYEVNYLLYNYFLFFQKEYRQKL